MGRSQISGIGLRGRAAVVASVSVAASIAACLLTLAVTASAAPARADHANHSCHNASLKGTYIYYNDGWLVSRHHKVPFSIAGKDQFNGAGSGHGVTTFDVNGKVVNSNTAETSTYTIRADCTGKLVFDTAGSLGHFDVYLGPAGRLVNLVETDRGTVGGGTITRVAR